MRWIWTFLVAPLLAAGQNAVIAGRAIDAETGRPVACTVTIRTSVGAVVTRSPNCSE